MEVDVLSPWENQFTGLKTLQCILLSMLPLKASSLPSVY